MNQEPYESMPDGDPHAAQDYIAKIIAWLMLVLIVAVTASCPAHAGENLCAAYADGWELGVCWRKAECYPAPVMCPIGLETADQAYMAGLRAGLSSGRIE